MKRLAVALALLLGAACGRDSPAEPNPDGQRCQRIAAAALDLPAPPALLQARRAALAARVGDGVLVLAASTPDPNPRDNGYRGESSLYYLAGLEVPDAWFVLHVRAGAVDSAILFLPEAQTSPTFEIEARSITGTDAVRCTATLGSTVRRMVVARARPLLSVSGNPALADTLLMSLVEERGPPTLVGGALAQLRMIKDSAEIARLRRAAQVTAQAIRGATPVIRAGGNEGTVAAAILGGFLSRGAAGASFPSIVAAGGSALTLHYNANDRPLRGDELILMDVGAEYGRYAGDVTRTWPVAGTFTARQRALYELVLGAQEAAIAAVRPGVTIPELESISRAYLREHGATLCGARTCDTYFSHALTHHLGLNVHDVRFGSPPLAPGMVLTIEPGIYLPADSIGIRIEDDVLVTATGHEVLSHGAPKTVAEIEALFLSRLLVPPQR